MNDKLPPLPEKAQIDKHIPTGIVIRGYTAEQMQAYARAAIEKDRERQSVPAAPLSFNCTNGCGACDVKLIDFVTHATQSQDGEPWVTVASVPQIVSTCCGSAVEVWDERKQEIVADVAAAPQPQPVQPQGPMAESVQEAARDVAKCLNERDGRGLDLRHVAMLVNHAQQPVQQEPVAHCELTKVGSIAFFDGRPMVMVGPVGNACHPHPLYTSPQAAQPLTKTQRADVCVKAESAMQRDPNLSWRDALMNETEKAHGITKGTP